MSDFICSRCKTPLSEHEHHKFRPHWPNRATNCPDFMERDKSLPAGIEFNADIKEAYRLILLRPSNNTIKR